MGYTIEHVTKQGVQTSDIYSYEFQEKRRIRLTGEVDDVMAEGVVAAIQYLDSVSDKEIEVIINSPGGSVTAGLAILDAMKEARSDIRTVCIGLGASMGALLVTCGGTKGKREIYPNAEMMIHQPLGGAQGQASDVQLTAVHLTKVKKNLVHLLAEATGKSPKKIIHDIDRNLWLDAQDAVAYGLVDRIR